MPITQGLFLHSITPKNEDIRGSFEKFVDWWQCAAEGGGDCYSKL
jgi:hypothetical protein